MVKMHPHTTLRLEGRMARAATSLVAQSAAPVRMPLMETRLNVRSNPCKTAGRKSVAVGHVRCTDAGLMHEPYPKMVAVVDIFDFSDV